MGTDVRQTHAGLGKKRLSILEQGARYLMVKENRAGLLPQPLSMMAVQGRYDEDVMSDTFDDVRLGYVAGQLASYVL